MYSYEFLHDKSTSTREYEQVFSNHKTPSGAPNEVVSRDALNLFFRIPFWEDESATWLDALAIHNFE